MLDRITQREFDEIFKIMSDGFPSDEYRNYDGQKDLFNEKRYKLFSLKNSEHISAFVAIWEFDDFLFVEHLAVEKILRGKGIGSYILDELKKMYNKPICLEVEPPEDEITQKRIAFYKRNGFSLNEFKYVQPAMDINKNPIPLMIMSSCGFLNEIQFTKFKNTLYKYVYKVGG